MATLIAALCLLIPASALAGPPTHLRKEASDITGLNHACGIATDSEGDVYVSSAGESLVRIYDPEGDPLGTVPNANTPCGLAVDTRGNLYVSESATGEVVRYEPSAYPFAAAPSYGPREVIDASGDAEGISVDPFDDRLYMAEGDRITMMANEMQSVSPFSAKGGFYRLSFEGSEQTAPIAFEGPAGEVQEALEDLSTIGAGNVSVANPGGAPVSQEHLITFTGALGFKDVPQLVGDASELIQAVPPNPSAVTVQEKIEGFSGPIVQDNLTNATGVAAYTYRTNATQQDRYLFVADAATDAVKTFGGTDVTKLELRQTNTGAGTPSGSFGFGPQGASLTVDQGTCPPEGQACTAGHLFVYDAAHSSLEEFEAGGRFLDEVDDPAFADAEPSAVAIDRSEGPSKGTLYLTAGAAAGAKALAFGPLAPPSRPPLPSLSIELKNACGAAVDSHGNRYVAADSFVHVYGPSGTTKLTTIADDKPLCEIAIDDAGRVYALDNPGAVFGNGRIVYFTPDSYPPTTGTKYSGPTVIAKPGAPLFENDEWLVGFALNPANGHVFVTQFNRTIELDSVENGAGLLDSQVAPGVGNRSRIAVDETTGKVFMVGPGGATTVSVLDMGAEGDHSDEQVIARIKGAGSPGGEIQGDTSVAVDQNSGHLLLFSNQQGAVDEYEETGTFVARIGEFKKSLVNPSGLAIDNSGGPNDGNLFVAYLGDEEGRKYEGLHAFGPLGYGEPPQALTGLASEVGGGSATLNGTVNPRGFTVEACSFEYLTQKAYEDNEKAEDPLFEGATAVPCAEGTGALGVGLKPVAVHADLSGLDPEGRYRFRLIAANEFGPSEGAPGAFGLPTLVVEPPNPVSYTEATARATIDPTGLPTEYFLEYGKDESYGQSTPSLQLDPEAGPSAVAIHLFGLAEAETYHLRLIAQNEAGEVKGPDQQITTLQRRPAIACANQEYRVGRSAGLPDCRAYELVTPADTRGTTPYAYPVLLNSWFADPTSGESLAYNTNGTLPGFAGSGRNDGYRAERGAGEHPEEGWSSSLLGPSYDQIGGGEPVQPGISPDQEYSFWNISTQEATAGVLDKGTYLSTPSGFEPIGRGSLGTDLEAVGRFLGRGGSHVVFSSKAHIEDDAAPVGTTAVYDRQAGATEAEVVSVKPDGTPFGAGENATYIGANDDASTIAFSVDGALYARRGGETVQVAASATFAGISEDGTRVFYVGAAVEGQAPPPGPLFACEVSAGPCAGPGAQAPTPIAADARFVNVSADGSHVYLTSTEVLDAEAKGVSGQDNLYLWDAGTGETQFIALLDSADLAPTAFEKTLPINLIGWLRAVVPAENLGVPNGKGVSPTRSTPDGSVLLFQSHASLTAYDSEGSAQIYRYEEGAEPGEELTCVSCNPSGVPPTADATLASFSTAPLVAAYASLIPNLSEDGQTAVFETRERLLPEDGNTVADVYEWRAQGSEWCKRAGGCLALISSGQADTDSHLYGVSPDGRDVFFSTLEKLAGADVAASSSIYDARIGGGIPDPPKPAPCQGDACQGAGVASPTPPQPGSSTPSLEGNLGDTPTARRCPKGKRLVRSRGKVRCVAKHRKPPRKANQKRRTGR